MKDRHTGDWIAISDDDAKLVIDHCTARWKLPIKLLYWYGFRASEVLALTPRNLEGDTLVVQRLKRGRLTRQALHPDIKNDLLALARTKLPMQRLFPYHRRQLWSAIQDAGRRVNKFFAAQGSPQLGIDRKFLHPHAFRHRVGRRGAENGRTPHELMAFLGHRSIQVSLMYTDLNCNPELSKKFF